MTRLRLPAFDPGDVEESAFLGYPEPYREAGRRCLNRRIGNHAGLGNFGVVLTRILPGGQSSFRHAHSRRDEFVYVLEGEVVLETDAGEQVLQAGMCAGFPAGTGDAHHFVNRASTDVVLLVVGDRSAGDAITYPDIDLRAELEPDGGYRVTRKDGTPY